MSGAIKPKLPFLHFSFRKKDINEQTPSHQLKRALSAVSLVSIGIGAIIGAGLFSLTGIAAAENAGPAITLSYLLGAIACVFVGLCYSEMASMIPFSGSAYTYSYVTMGELVAWIVGWDLILEYGVASATVAVSWSQYVAKILDSWGIHLSPRFLSTPFETVTLSDGSQVQAFFNLPAVFIICAISLLLIKGITDSARINNIIVGIKIAVIVAVIGFGIPYIETANYQPFIPPNTGVYGHYGWSGVITGAGTVFFAYIGFDAVSTAAQEAKKPARDIPIGILGSLAICSLAYITFSIVLTGMVRYSDMVGDASPVITAINKTPYLWLKNLIGFGIICGFTSVILVMLLGQSRILFSMSRDGLLPKLFSTTHQKWQTPWYTQILLMICVSIIAAVSPIQKLAHMTSIGTLFAFTIVSIGVIILRVVEPHKTRKFRIPGGFTIPILGILTCGMMMLSLDSMTWLRLILWLTIGIIIYFCYGRYNSKLQKK
ncbi:amino acid permease [Entomobacter blattae]|uniref:Putative amino acid permease YhdG n=1 Tax=Entomobacter blattae TaxID=2762277 RepID=A0A7H1NSZ3_9PROT|nr:amino acid permease [Entomobacter blattae]QNT78903.1 putative amino acid permease YhdG [Entomobacter blattae]